jgi:ABC-type nitrate/sulfonate/bicarbonate transport system permease component
MIREVLIPEALPGVVSGFTVTLVTLIGASAMAGAVGAGGLGDLAIRDGYQRFETDVMIGVIVALIVIVSRVQFAGDRIARRLNRRLWTVDNRIQRTEGNPEQTRGHGRRAHHDPGGIHRCGSGSHQGRRLGR